MSSKPFSNKCTPAKNEECKKKAKNAIQQPADVYLKLVLHIKNR
jgi:hypothetical protein